MGIRHSLSLLYEGRKKQYATGEILEGAFSRRNLSQDMSTQLTRIRRQGEKEDKMNKFTKKILSVVMALAMILSTMTVTFAEDAKTIQVTMTIERLTIGQGFLVEPITVEVEAGEGEEGPTVKDVLEKVAQECNIYLNSSIEQSGYSLNSISYADTGVLNIPQKILDMPSIDVNYGEGANYHYDAPTNTSINALFEDERKLGSFSYNDMAGWMYVLNNSSNVSGMGSQPVNDGDVVRVQFSVYGYGVDLGFESYYDNIETLQLANKDKLIKQVAGVDAEGEYKDARAAAMEVLEKYDATQEEVNQALADLGYVEETTEPEKTQPATTEEQTTIAPTTGQITTSVKLARAKINKLTNVKKYKVKIKVNKVTGANGYQYRYAINKKFKKSKVKITTKRTFTTKKLSKNVRCYVKVRAYVKVNGKRNFGKWSKVKSIKVKK